MGRTEMKAEQGDRALWGDISDLIQLTADDLRLEELEERIAPGASSTSSSSTGNGTTKK